MNSKNLIIIGAIILVLGGAVYLLWNRETNIINIQSQGTSIVAFGDSLVQGVGATEGNDFITLLEQKVAEPIVNLGKSGDTTESAIGRIDTIWEHDPKIVIVLLGGNDYLRRVPIETTFTNLDTIVKEIHSHGAAVLLLGVRGGLIRDTYNSRFTDFAKSHGVGFVPNVLDDIIGNKELMSDTIHPNDKGYILVTNKIAPELKRILGKMRENN